MERKTKKRPSTWKNFISLIKKIKFPILLMAIAFLINMGRAVIGLILPEKMAEITEFDISSGDNVIVQAAISVCITIFVISAVEFIVGLVAAYITYIAKARINRDFRIVASKKVFSLKTADIEAKDPKEFISRITTDTGFISEFLIDLAVNEIPRLYFLISTIVKVAQMDNGVLAASFIAVIPVIILGSLWSGHVTYKTQNKLQASIAQLTAKLAEKINNIETIKAYNKSEDEIASGEVYIDDMKKAQKKTTMAAAFNQLIANIIFVVPTVIIMLAGAIQLLNGSITVAQFIIFYGLGATYQKYIADHLTLWVLAKRAQGASLRISEVMQLEEDLGGSEKAEKSGDIEFKNVSFSYGENKILSDISFSAESGKKIAIVGPSGSGKSTILNLIEQFYRPESGSITLDGKDISEYEIRSYRDIFSYLPQNAPGFSGTVRDMLAYGSEKVRSDEEYYAMLEKVGMLESVKAMGGLDREVGTNASKLSGGQRQRLAIARMLLSEADIILADEATSALDIEGARKTAALIDEYAAGKTRIIVAHNISTVADADKIIVVDRGRIVDMGTHSELMERCGLYRDLQSEEKEAENR